MEAGNKPQMALILKQYKTPNGAINYPAVFCIPSNDRITKLAADDFNRVNLLLIGALTMALESINLKRGLNEMQILDLSECIIDSASEDNLSFEDIMLFLQNMVRGKYEMSYESMDVPKFMRMLNIYRDERKAAILDYRENMHLQYKGIGDATRTAKADPLSEHFSRLGDTISSLKSNLKETKKENQTLKSIDKWK